MPHRYAAQTTVKRDASLAEIERTLQRYGADAFMYGWQAEFAVIGLRWHGRQYQIRVPMPQDTAAEFWETPTGRPRSASAARQLYDQAMRQRWRALALYIKATLEAIELGIMSQDDAFLSFTMLPGGGTIGQRIAVDHMLASGELPPLLPG